LIATSRGSTGGGSYGITSYKDRIFQRPGGETESGDVLNDGEYTGKKGAKKGAYHPARLRAPSLDCNFSILGLPIVANEVGEGKSSQKRVSEKRR